MHAFFDTGELLADVEMKARVNALSPLVGGKTDLAVCGPTQKLYIARNIIEDEDGQTGRSARPATAPLGLAATRAGNCLPAASARQATAPRGEPQHPAHR